MIAKDIRYKRSRVVAPCVTETREIALFMCIYTTFVYSGGCLNCSKQMLLNLSTAAIFAQQTLSCSNILNISDKWDSLQTLPGVTCWHAPIHSVYSHTERGRDIRSFSRLMSKPSPKWVRNWGFALINKVYHPFSLAAWSPLYNN